MPWQASTMGEVDFVAESVLVLLLNSSKPYLWLSWAES